MAKKKIAKPLKDSSEPQNQTDETSVKSSLDQQSHKNDDGQSEGKDNQPEQLKQEGSPLKLSDRELIENNPYAPVHTIQGAYHWQDKDFIFLEGAWRWIPNADAWEFVRQHNVSANEPKNFVNITELQPLGKEISL